MIFAGIGGQGVLLASEITALVAFNENWEVKKSEVHGMAQRGGSVVSHLRLAKEEIWSPLIPRGQGDILVAFNSVEGPRYIPWLKQDATVINADLAIPGMLPHFRTTNVFLLGCLARLLPFSTSTWEEVIRENVRPDTVELNLKAFRMGLETKLPERETS